MEDTDLLAKEFRFHTFTANIRCIFTKYNLDVASDKLINASEMRKEEQELLERSEKDNKQEPQSDEVYQQNDFLEDEVDAEFWIKVIKLIVYCIYRKNNLSI